MYMIVVQSLISPKLESGLFTATFLGINRRHKLYWQMRFQHVIIFIAISSPIPYLIEFDQLVWFAEAYFPRDLEFSEHQRCFIDRLTAY